MVDLLISIKPEFGNRILEGEKTYEFRKTRPRRKIDRVIMYATCPEKSIIGMFQVAEIISGTPRDVWARCGSSGGIDQVCFFAYCGESKVVYGLRIVNPVRFDPPIDPFGENETFTPPQSFAYLESQDFRRRVFKDGA